MRLPPTGFLSSDFGVHPVVTLIRGLLTSLNPQQFRVSCYALYDEPSWWRSNVSAAVPLFRNLMGKSHSEVAQVMLDDNLHVLVDLNGHTMRSGIPVLEYRPAPVQLSFLGYSLTTGLPSVDFFVGDPVATPPHHQAQFTERLLLMPHSFFVNDYAVMQSHVLNVPRPRREALLLAANATAATAPRKATLPAADAFVFATFSNYQKLSPDVFDTWCAVLRRVPNSVLWVLRHHAYAVRVVGQVVSSASRRVCVN